MCHNRQLTHDRRFDCHGILTMTTKKLYATVSVVIGGIP